MLRVIKEGTDEYDLLQDYESFKKYNRKKENNIVNFQLLNYTFDSAKMTFDTNLIVLLINGCIQNNVNLDIEICVMDKYTENYYSKKGLKTVIVSNENNKKFLKQDSKDFGKYMITKLDIIHTYLKNNSHVTYLDGDSII